ncbi:MAG: phosphatidate cytidylyltransferase [Syntrophomonadales bacterium]|jgi:phosphatidate cytidylyltransferase
MKERVLSAAVGIPAILLLAWLGGYYWMTLAILAAFIGLYEFYRGIKAGGHSPVWLAGCLVLVWALTLNSSAWNHILGVASLLLSVIILVILYPRYHIIDLAISWFGALYVGILMGYIWKLGTLHNHFWIILFALLLTWASDTGAYFAGKAWGKRKLAPKLSPNKTWEGFIGGFLATILVSAAGCWIIPGYSLYQYIGIGIAVGLIAPIGDLFASGVKRGFNIKDFGRLIPGHGGVLDRLDSFMCVAPLIYLLVAGWGG